MGSNKMSLTNYFSNIVKYLNPKISAEENITDAKIIQDIVLKHSQSHQVVDMINGENYYYSENEILKRTMTYYCNNQDYIDYNRSNFKVAHNFHRPIVDQLVQYILKNVTFESKDDYTNAILASFFDKSFNHDLLQFGKEARNKGIAWWHPYINDDGEFKIVKFPSETIIPLWDTKTQTHLVQAIRYYDVDFVDKKGNEMKRYRVELYDEDKITYYQQDESNAFYFDVSIQANPVYYNTINKVSGIELQGWGRVPLIPLFCNDKQKSDLSIYKSMIDAYDVVESDSVNNLADIQDVVWVLKNYGGESLSEFMVNLKVKKAISVDDNGDAKPVTAQIPYEARENVLNRLKKNIYLIGQAVDTTSADVMSVNSGRALQILYNSLDLKANEFELHVRKALKKVLKFMNIYLKMVNKPQININDVEITFNRYMISNEVEKVDSLVKVKDDISKRTFLQNLPYIDDVDAELEQIEKEKEDAMEKERQAMTTPEENIANSQGTLEPLYDKENRPMLDRMSKIV
jgi:SPP1 family phage portal protein